MLLHEITLLERHQAILLGLLAQTAEALPFISFLLTLSLLHVHDHLFLGLWRCLGVFILVTVLKHILRILTVPLLGVHIVVIKIKDALANLEAVKEMVGH